MAVILLVEDEVVYRTMISKFLEAAGHSVLLAGSGLDVVKMLHNWNGPVPDLIITDQMMPGMSGYEVVRVLRTQEATRKVPILMLTAYAQLKDVITEEQVPLLDKQTSLKDILAVVEKLLQEAPKAAKPLPPPKPLHIQRDFY